MTIYTPSLTTISRTLACLVAAWLIAGPVRSQAQSANQDPDPTHWIDYAQVYYRVSVAENGVYRLTTTELQRAGVPVQQIDPATVQLFHRGVEQAIYVHGEADGRFDADDYLEFYGQRNDGTPDSLLYQPHAAQPHRYYSLFSDTTAYFLTWPTSAGKSGKRMTTYTDTAYTSLAPEAYHWAEELRLFTDDYPGWPAGVVQTIEYSYYEAGEGYTGIIRQKDKPYTTTFQLPGAVRDGPAPQLDILLAGRDFTGHRVDCLAGPTSARQSALDSVRFTGYTNAHIRHEVPWAAVSPDGQVIVSTTSRGEAGGTDAYSVSYVRVRYPQHPTANGQTQTVFRLEQNPAGRSRLAITDVLPGTRFWDVTNPDSPVWVGATTTPTDTVHLVVRQTDTPRTLFSSSQFRTAPDIRRVVFTDWRNRKPGFLIVSHEALMQPTGPTGTPDAIRAYAQYRASAAGGGYDTLTATMQQLFDQYSYGERHPLAIRRFARQMLRQTGGAAPYLLLIGRGRSTPGIRHNPQQARLDMVMTAGFPGSDGAFTAGLLPTDPDIPALPTGRINAGTAQEVLDYLSKVQAYEHPTDDGLWRKNFLHLSGGQSAGERALFRGLVDLYQQQAAEPSLGARTTTFSKTTDNPVESLPTAKPVNEGAGVVTFFGHSGLDVTDLDIGFCSDDALGYRNAGRYPLLLVNGCAIGNFFFGRPTITTDWVLTPGRGAIAAIAQSHLGYTDVMNEYSTQFYNLLTDSTHLTKSLGQLQQETIRRVLARTPGGRALANTQQMVLQGDPAIRLFPFPTPDYALNSGGLTVRDTDSQPLTALSDSVRLQLVVQNAGQYRPGTLAVRVQRLVNGRESGVFNLTVPHSVAYRDTLTLTFPNDRLGEGQTQFTVTINPTGVPDTQAETNRANNRATIETNVAPQQPVLIYPPDGSVVNTTTVRLTAQYFGEGTHPFDLELDSTARFDSPFGQAQRLTADATISYRAILPARANTTYYWRVRRADSAGGSAPWSTASFTYAPGSSRVGLPEGQLRLVGAGPSPVEQGTVVFLPVQFINLSPYPFGTDSLLVRQTIYPAGANPLTKQWQVPAPTAADTIRFTVAVPTEKLPGSNRVVLTVNPRLQPESSFLNNTLNVALPVQPDRFGPLLEVAFDGARITDGAVVSARPRIDVLVADENRALIRHDTTGLVLYLQRPGQNALERLTWQKATVQPAETDSAFRIRYASPALSAGVYGLLATARDAVGNEAVPYRVSFRVVDEPALTRFVAYPNPFGSQTRFAFTLTGPQAPEGMVITLFDSNGIAVRHLALPARVGLNEWAWDGRSDGGVPLPAGVYTYQFTLSGSGAWSASAGTGSPVRGRLILVR